MAQPPEGGLSREGVDDLRARIMRFQQDNPGWAAGSAPIPLQVRGPETAQPPAASGAVRPVAAVTRQGQGQGQGQGFVRRVPGGNLPPEFTFPDGPTAPPYSFDPEAARSAMDDFQAGVARATADGATGPNS